MRDPIEQLEDLLVLIVLTPFGAKAREHGLERWAIDCARRAMVANLDVIGSWAGPLRRGLEHARTRLGSESDSDETAAIVAAIVEVGGQLNALGPRRPVIELAHPATVAIRELISGTAGPDRVAAAARQAFERPDLEASAQFRRLLVFTGLLASGPELLIQLDHAESLGRLAPEALARLGIDRAWLELRRTELMTDDEACRHAVVERCFYLLYDRELA